MGSVFAGLFLGWILVRLAEAQGRSLSETEPFKREMERKYFGRDYK